MSSWVLHCGSQHKTPGQSNTDFDLNLNQTLEFPDETKCTIFNVNIPNSLPNVCDAFENKTWEFTFRMYALGGTALPERARVDGRGATNTFALTDQITSGLFHSEYTLRVSIPDGSYSQSASENLFSEPSHVIGIADSIYNQNHIPAGAGVSTASTDLTVAANSQVYSQLLVPAHRYSYSTGDRVRTYAEILQTYIRHEQQILRNQALTGTDGLGGVQIIWTDPADATVAQLAANENYKQRIIRWIVSDMNINVFTNANNQPEFVFRTNLCHYAGVAPVGTAPGVSPTGTIHSHYLGNAFYFGPVGTVPMGATPSGQLTTSVHVNPWMNAGVLTGIPTHFVQAKIKAPANIKFKGRSATNCLDFYHKQFVTIPTATAANTSKAIIGDIHNTAAGASTERAGGNFTAYGNTWNTFPITADRNDLLKPSVFQDGTDGWFGCCYFGVRKAASNSVNTAELLAHEVVYMYSPAVFTTAGEPALYLTFVCDVELSRRIKGVAPALGSNTIYPQVGDAGEIGGALQNEMLSNIFNGTSVFVSSARLPTSSSLFTGPANFGCRLIDVPTMDYESTPTFIIEIEMFGTGNHMKFNGSGDCKRVSIMKRMVLNSETYAGFISNNANGESTFDYGTSLGLSKVSSIKCHVLNEKGEVIRLTHADSFPPWTFSLAFEC